MSKTVASAGARKHVDVTVTNAGKGQFSYAVTWDAPADWGSGASHRYGRRRTPGGEQSDTNDTSWSFTANSSGIAVDIRAETDDGESAWERAS